MNVRRDVVVLNLGVAVISIFCAAGSIITFTEFEFYAAMAGNSYPHAVWSFLFLVNSVLLALVSIYLTGKLLVGDFV